MGIIKPHHGRVESAPGLGFSMRASCFCPDVSRPDPHKDIVVMFESLLDKTFKRAQANGISMICRAPVNP